MTLTVYYEGDLVDATKISYTKAVNSKCAAEFSVPNVLGENFATWEARKRVGVIRIYDDDVCDFTGIITSNSNKDPLVVTCEGYIGKMDYDQLSEEEGKFLLDEFKIRTAPTDENLKVIDPDGNPDVDDVEYDPGLTNDQYNGAYPGADAKPRYLIISDKTFGERDDEWQPTEAPTLTVLSQKGPNDYTETLTEDGTFYITENEGQSGDGFIKYAVKLEDFELPNDSQIHSLKIEYSGLFFAYHTALGLPKWRNLDIWWSTDGTLTNPPDPDKHHYITTWSVQSTLAGATVKTFLSKPILINKDEIDTWFNSGDDFWEDGYLVFRTNEATSTLFAHQGCEVWQDFIKVTITSSTANFDPINRRIRDTLNDGSGFYDVIKVDNAAGDGFEDLSGKGINKGDQAVVSMDWNDAVQLCSNGVQLTVPEVNEGVDQNYSNVSKYLAFQQLCDDQNLLYYQYDTTDEDGDDSTEVIAINEDDIPAATVTYDASNDPPSLNQDIIAEDNEWGSVTVQYYDGVTPKLYATTPPADPRNKPLSAKWIITRNKAISYGTKWAEYYSKKHYSIGVSWGYTPTNKPVIGTKYTFTLQKKNGEAVTTVTYSDQLCRRITKSQEDSTKPVITMGWFGGGSTPPAEKQGMWEGQVNRDKKIDEALRSTGQYQPVTRYSQLNGIPSTFTPAEHGNEAHSSTFITAAAKLNSLAAPDGSVAMNNQKLTGLAAGSSNGDSVRYEQIPTNASFTLNGLGEKSYNNLTDKPTIPTVEDTPTDGHDTIAISSNALYDHAALTIAAHGGGGLAMVYNALKKIKTGDYNADDKWYLGGNGAATLVNTTYITETKSGSDAYRWTLIVAGYYRFSGFVLLEGLASTKVYNWYIIKNGAIFKNFDRPVYSGTDQYYLLHVDCIVYSDGDDYFSIVTNFNGGNSAVYNNGEFQHLTIEFLGNG